MAKTKTKSSPQPEAASEAAEGSEAPVAADLDKVRDILFGSQSRDFEKRFARLEQHLNRELELLKDTVNRRFDTLEAYVKEEDEALRKRLGQEHQQRTTADDELTADLKALTQSLKETRQALEDQLSESEGTLRSRLLDQSNELTQAMQQQYDTLSSALDRSTDELRDEKTDRHTLADLFESVSLHLRNGHAPEGG